MRILHLYKRSLPSSFGGVERVIDQIAIGSLKLGLEPEVLSLSLNSTIKTEKYNNYLVHKVNQNFEISSCGFSTSAFRRFIELSKNVDIVHYHFPWPFMDLLHLSALVKTPSVVTYHSDIVRQKVLAVIYRPLMNKFLGSVDHIVATSPNYAATSETLLKFEHKVSVIPIGIDRRDYPEPSQERIAYWRTIFKHRFFLFTGVFRSYKGLDILLKAAKGLSCPILIVGTGPLGEKLKHQAVKLRLRNVHFLGVLTEPDKIALLRLCLAVVAPSNLRSEAFCLSLLEGAMYGKPMISCDIGTGTSFVNISNETGLVVPPSDPVALRQAMQYLWDHPCEAIEMGRRAEERYRANFTGAQMVRSYCRLYSDLAQRKQQPEAC